MAWILWLLQTSLLLNLNTAPAESLQQLPIGYEDAVHLAAREGQPLETVLQTAKVPKWKAVRIVTYRTLHGPFSSVYDLYQVPGITSGDIARWKAFLTVHPPTYEGQMIRDVENIRGLAASEEGPRTSAFDYWLYRLRAPIFIKKAKVEDLQSLPGVSLLDAVAAIRYARKAQLFQVSNLRRAPELSSYGYFNLRPFVAIQERPLPPVYGWASVSLDMPDAVVYSTDYLYDRLQQLESQTSDDLSNRLTTAGWSSDQIDTLLARLNAYRDAESTIRTSPYVRFKSVWNVPHGVRGGLAFHQSPFYLEGPVVRLFGEYVSDGPVQRILLGDYRIALDQGVMIDNSEESRDRLFDRDQGVFGDLTASRTMGLRGGFTSMKWNRFHLGLYASKTRRPVLLDRNNQPLFLFTGSFIPKILWDRGVDERVLGGMVDVDLPSPFLIGSRLRFHLLDIRYSDTLSMRFEDLDLPFDREDFSYDASIPRTPTDRFRFLGVAFQTVKFPMSLEVEAARQIEGSEGWAFTTAIRIQKPRFFWNIHYRRYDPGFLNPFQRSFQEDNRFEDTPLERPYRLVDPLASALREFPIPKPEEGFFLETRYQIHRKWLIPRFYVDVWRDLGDGLWNYRINVEGEFRPVHPLRIRYRERYQKRQNLRGVGYTQSFSEERALRVFVLLGQGIAGTELRMSQVDLTPRVDLPRSGMKGGFVSLFLRYDLTSQTQVQAGTAVWTNEGASQWIFEDTGIDFLYGNGSKFYVTVAHALSDRLVSRLKVRMKHTLFPHNVDLDQGIQDVWGRPVEGSFSTPEPSWWISWNLDYFF